MFKVFFAAASLSLAVSAYAAGGGELEIQGCSFTTQSYSKGPIPNSYKWRHGFDVEKRQGWGLPTTKQYGTFGKFYVGEAQIDEDGTVLEVIVYSQSSQKLTVKASIKKISGDRVEVSAVGTGMGQATVFGSGNRVFAGVEIQNPLISSILESDKTVTNPRDSVLFPENTMVFAGANVTCDAVTN